MRGARSASSAAAAAAFQNRVLCVGDREARADRQGGELIDRIAASLPVRKLVFIEALGHARVPFAGHRPDHRGGVELATIDAHRAAEAAADLERRLDDGVAGEARRDRFEIGDFAGRGAAGHSVPPRQVTCQVGAHGPQFYADKRQNGPARMCIPWRPRGSCPLRLTSNRKRESAMWGTGEHGAFGLRARCGAVEGPHFHTVAETALLILGTRGPPQGFRDPGLERRST
jgi:hypothetical protein